MVVAIIVVLTGAAILQGRADAHRTAEVAASNLSTTIADNLNGAIDRVDISLLAILDEVYRQQRAGGWDQAAIDAAIARQDARHPDLIGFRIYGADGRLRAGVKNIVNRNADISRRADFESLRDSGDAGLVVAAPIKGQVAQQRLIPLGRRITNPDGSFGGAVYGAISIRGLTREFASVDIGPHGIVVLVHDSLKVAARLPQPAEADHSGGISGRFRAIIASGAATARYDMASPVDGIRRIVSIRRVKGRPYYVLVGLAESDILADWSRSSTYFLLFGVLTIGLVVVGALILHQRVSDWQRATAALAEQTELLTQSNADLERFAYVASHDLRTPLRNIISYAQLLEHRYKGRLDGDADDFIEFIVNSGKYMTLLITDLLEYSRVTSQDKPLEPIASGAAATQALVGLKAGLDEAGAEVVVGELPWVMAERSHLVSLFQNLLGNGLKYRAPDRRPHLSVTAEQVAPDRWRFAVADNGIGIEAEYFDRIFEIFQRLNPAAKPEGTGIGLTVCRRIVHRFGGTIWVESSPGQGTTFFFTLRAAAP